MASTATWSFCGRVPGVLRRCEAQRRLSAHSQMPGYGLSGEMCAYTHKDTHRHTHVCAQFNVNLAGFLYLCLVAAAEGVCQDIFLYVNK